MTDATDALAQSDAELLREDVSDEALERAAAGGMAEAANPTVPSAIICIPFDAH